MKQWNFLREQWSRMIQQMFSAEEAVMDRLASQGREIFGLVWENTEGPSPIQVWRKKDRFEMRFGNRVVQSSCLRSDPNQLLLSYTRHMMLCLLLVPEPRKVLHIGLGGGTIANFLHRLFPEVEQTVIEINEAVLEAACQFFGFEEDSRRKVIIADAAEGILELDESFDLIFLDAYGPASAPEKLISIPFITRLSELLVPGGWAVGNFWTMNGDYEEQCSRWKKIYPTLYQARTRPTANKIIFGRKNGKASLNGSLKDRARFLQKKTRLDMLKMLVNLEKID